jgi:hypothetical protein
VIVRRNSALACVVTCLFVSPASEIQAAQASSGVVTRVYSHIDDARSNRPSPCKTTRISGDKEYPIVEERCPSGANGWPVTIVYEDARAIVTFGRQEKSGGVVIGTLNGTFADPHSVIEWRLLNGTPFAVIHRYFFNNRQALTIHRLNGDMTSCVAAVVNVERGHDANAEAVRIADEIVPTFRCASDKMIIVGHAAQYP